MNEENSNEAQPGGIPEVVVKKHGRFSVIWIIPLIAAGIGGWLIYQSYIGRGVPITITFESGEGLASGRTQIRYRGLPVGQVDSLQLGRNIDQVIVKATLNKSAGKLARKGSKFWVVRPRIGMWGVSGLGTLLSGEYIEVRPGKGARAKSFVGLDQPPLFDEDASELRIVLETGQFGSLQAGAPIYYREVEVGQVAGHQLADNADSVKIHIFIDEEYAPLVRKNTKFWNASGIDVKFGLFSGVEVDTESLRALLAGGIAFATPDNRAMGNRVENGAVFKLHAKPKKKWLEWEPEIPLKDQGQTIDR